MGIPVTRGAFTLQIPRKYLLFRALECQKQSSMDPRLPETSKALIPPPKPTRKRRRELTNTQRAEIREFFFHDPNRKPSQKGIIQWFENEHYHTLTQG